MKTRKTTFETLGSRNLMAADLMGFTANGWGDPIVANPSNGTEGITDNDGLISQEWGNWPGLFDVTPTDGTNLVAVTVDHTHLEENPEFHDAIVELLENEGAETDLTDSTVSVILNDADEIIGVIVDNNHYGDGEHISFSSADLAEQGFDVATEELNLSVEAVDVAFGTGGWGDPMLIESGDIAFGFGGWGDPGFESGEPGFVSDSSASAEDPFGPPWTW